MKFVVSFALALFLALGTVWSEDNPQDNEAFSLMKLDRADLLKAIGTPLEEVTDPRYTQGVWQSIVVQQDKEAKSFYFYFLADGRVAAFASADYFADGDTRLDEDLHGLKEEVEGRGYVAQNDPSLDGPSDALYFDPNTKEFVGARVVSMGGDRVLYGLYTTSQAALGPVGQAAADLYEGLK